MMPLKRAVSLLHREGYTCVLCDRDRVLTSREGGILPLLERCEEGENCREMSVADRVIGKAAAMLLVQMQVREAHGDIMSTKAQELLQAHGIAVSCGLLVPGILDRSGKYPCPMEQAVADLTDPHDAPAALRAAFERLRKETK